MDLSRGFKGVWIPREVWLSDKLTMIEKIIFVEIDSLDSLGQGCFASNKYLAEFCGCSVPTVTRSISKLSKLGLINFEGSGKQRKIKTTSSFRLGNLINLIRKPNHFDEEINIDNNIYIYNNTSHIENECDEAEEKKSKKFDEKSDPYLLAKFLEKNIMNNNPKFPSSEKQKQRWAKDIDKMIRIDKIKPDDIANVISFCQKDSFWRCNILSGKKLRDKYQQLSMKMIG